MNCSEIANQNSCIFTFFPTNDFEDLGKLQSKADIGIFIGYSPSKKAYRIYNKRTRQIMETMNVQFDELTQMAFEQLGSGPDLHGLTSGHINVAEFDSDTFTNPFAPPDTSSANPRGIFINQSKYALEMLKKYGLDQCDAIDIPMVGQSKLDEDPNGTLVDLTSYRGMVESLMYHTASCPDLVFVVCMCARYQEKPTEKHLIAVKPLSRYLKGTINMGLRYLKDTGFNLTAFLDADHAGCQDSRKSTSDSA
ncbi:uncharacterized mitochondrial protein-like protein [Tanacetum coccineum]